MASRKPVVLVEVLDGRCLCVDHKSIGDDEFACLQTALNRAANQKSAQSAPLVICMRRQSSHPETRDRVAWQFLLCARIELHSVNLSRTQTVVAQYGVGGLGVDQHANDCYAFFALLGSKALEVDVELTHPRRERLAIMSGGIKRLFFKHV